MAGPVADMREKGSHRRPERRRFPAATWSSVWYLLSSFAVISYTSNWIYVCFAAAGSWIGAYVSLTFNRSPPNKQPPVNVSPE